MKKIIYMVFLLFVFCIGIDVSYAVTIRETIDNKDEYSTIEEGSIIIGTTKFLPDNIVTASKATMAGANDAMLYVMQNGSTDGYENPSVYYYVDSVVGWFYLDSNNKAIAVTDVELLNKLSNLDIYYVNNVEKVLEIEYIDNDIDLNSLPDGVGFRDNKLFVNASISKFDIVTNDKKKVSYVMDKTTSQFIKDTSSCYTVLDGVIIDYDFTCGSDIVIPVEIDGEEITGVGVGAFKGVNLVNVVIPKEIKSIGSNAFAENKLESVIIKDKYDKRDFSKYGDNVFGGFDGVVYDNDLSRSLNHIDNEYVINYYDSFDIDNFKDNPFNLSGIREYVGYNLINQLKDNGYDLGFEFCMHECDIENGELNYELSKDMYDLDVSYIEDSKYKISLVKNDFSNKNRYVVSKIINVKFNKAGTENDNEIVKEAIKNLRMDGRHEYLLDDFDIVTRYKYLEDLEDLYGIDLLLTMLPVGGHFEYTEEIVNFRSGWTIYYLKDNVLYQYTDFASVIGLSNNFEPLLPVENFNNIDEYVDALFDYFTEKTGVTNYEIVYNSDGSIFDKIVKEYETGISYYIELIDKDFGETWTIKFVDYYEDKYDNNGNTKKECFEFNDGVITDYDGSCGINVVIPNKINNILVTEIDDYNSYGENVFSGMNLRSVVLPDSLIKIGNSVFSENKLTEIKIPESVVEIGNSAFYKNKLTGVVIPDSVKIVGSSAFSSNNIESVKISSSLDKISSSVFSNNNIKEIDIPLNIKSIEYSAFSENEIEELILLDGVVSIGNDAFKDNKITSLVLPESIKEIGDNAFNNNQLDDNDAFIYARKYDFNQGKYIWDYDKLVSYGGKNRKNIVIPDSVKKIGRYTFYNLGIENISLPYGLIEIDDYAFSSNKLTSLIMPDTVTYVGRYVFDDNNFTGNDSFIYTSDKDGNIDYSSLVAYSNSDSVKELIIPDKVKKIWDYAFSNVVVGSIYIPYGVLEIGDEAFSTAHINKEFTLPKSIVKLGSNVFEGNSLEGDKGYVYARNEDGSIDKSILMAYAGYFTEESITLPDGIVEIRENCFNSNYYVKNIVLPSSLKKLGDNAFNLMYSLENILILGKSSYLEFDEFGNDVFNSNVEIKFES